MTVTVRPTSNLDVYCYLKSELEPHFQVLAEPAVGYFDHWKYCYRILRDGVVVEELAGDFRELPAGMLVLKAREIVDCLKTPDCAVSPHQTVCNSQNADFRKTSRNDDSETCSVRQQSATPVAGRQSRELPFASRLPPRQTSDTWFSSGRAAFAWLTGNVIRPARVYLPSLVCWSLVDVMLTRFPEIPLHFYPVDRNLDCHYPNNCRPDDAIVFIHYFGHQNSSPRHANNCTWLEDVSHRMMSSVAADSTEQTSPFVFGSLRKTYRVADGGFVRGSWNPQYEPRYHHDAWLRLNACDWRDMREAENMTDRSWSISDISSQSLAVILQTDESAAANQRRSNNTFLEDNLCAGNALIDYRTDECPLLHCRTFSTQQERDSLRNYLCSQRLFTSVHWPVHHHLRNQSDRFDITDAAWLADHSLAIPVAEDFGTEHMERVCDAVRDWSVAGSVRPGTCDSINQKPAKSAGHHVTSKPDKAAG